jgi:SAM-dependent methyltransferase
MTDFDAKAHWERIHSERSPLEVSWYQREPTLSLALVRQSGVLAEHPIVDVGGGASTLVDTLLAAGYRRLAVLDISARALAHAKARLGAAATQIEWYETDVTAFAPPHRFALWHDRAVFHFLTEEHDRDAYLRSLDRALLPDGQVIIAAFAIGGPSKCSGLNIVQYDAASLGIVLGARFKLLETVSEAHLTPRGDIQLFGYHRFMRQLQ